MGGIQLKRKISLICIFIVLCLFVTACAANIKQSGSPTYQEDQAGVTTGLTQNSEMEQGNISSDLKKRKLIKDVKLRLETRKFDTFVSELRKEINLFGGFIQTSEITGNSYSYDTDRYASLTIRIPSDKLDDFTNKVSSLGNVTEKSEGSKDVTLDYVDKQSRIKALKTEQDSLLRLLEAVNNLNDIITIQNQLTDVRHELESLESQLRTYDDLIDYSTVTMNVYEVERETPAKDRSMWQEIGENLSENVNSIGKACQNLFVYFVSSLPFLLIMAVIALVTLIIIRLAIKKNKRDNKQQIQAQSNQDDMQQK